jgi:glycosyltransferase involved in cell wall biosynthesis
VRIVLPVHQFPPRYSAGAELYSLRLARWLLAHGHEVEVVCIESVRWDGRDRVEAQHELYQSVPVWRLALESSPEGWWPRNYDSPELAAWFADYLRASRPDVVHFQAGYLIGAGPLRAAAAAGVPTVLTLHDFWYLCPRITLLRGDGKLCAGPPENPGTCAWCMRLEGRGARLADRLSGGIAGRIGEVALTTARERIAARRRSLLPALRLPDTVIAPSRFLAEQYRPYLPPGRLQVLRYGLDTERLQATPAPPDDGTLRLAYIGQIAAHKGVHVLAMALRALPANGRPVTLTIYGDLDQHAAYSRRLRSIIAGEERIRLAGRFENSRLAEVLADVDALVVPSIWYENSPLAIMEGHAARRPVLTSALGGMAELVRDEIDGLLFRPGDAADLARQIQRLREEPGLLARLRRGVRQPATIDDEMQSLLGIYDTVRTSASLDAIIGMR